MSKVWPAGNWGMGFMVTKLMGWIEVEAWLVQSKRATKSNRRSFDSAEVRFAQDDN
jgi:hypothetical protein